MADPEDVQDDADEAQATAEDADARAEAAESNALPSGLTGAPPPEALPQAPAAPVGSVVNPPPGTPAAPAAPANPEEARQQEFAAGTEGVTAAQGRVSATEEGGNVEQRRLDAEEEARRNESIDRQADEQARIDTRDDFQRKVQAAEDNVKNFKFQDHYANESTARKAANAISVFLGGLGNLGGQAPGAANYALQALEQHEKEDYDQQLAYLNSAKYLADKKREGYTDLLKQQSEDRRVAELNFAAKRAAITDEFAAQASQSRNKTAVAAAQEEVARRKADVAKRQTDVFKDIETEKYQQARAQAALLKAQRHKGGGGGGNPGALADFEAAAQAIPPGAPVPREVYALASKAGFKLKDVQAQVDRARESGKKSLPGGKPVTPGELPKDTIFYKNNPIGLAPSGRGGAAGFTKSLIAYDDGLESLEALKKHVIEHPVIGRLARGDAYNRAVLAISATTTANPSDTTTKHEADTLKGLLSITPEAIQTSIDHVREKRQALLGTVRPLPKQASGGGGEPQTEAGKKLHESLTSLGAVKLQ